MTHIVGDQIRSEFILDPLLALQRGRVLDRMLSSAAIRAQPGVTRAAHRVMNLLDDERQREAARRLNAPSRETTNFDDAARFAAEA